MLDLTLNMLVTEGKQQSNHSGRDRDHGLVALWGDLSRKYMEVSLIHHPAIGVPPHFWKPPYIPTIFCFFFLYSPDILPHRFPYGGFLQWGYPNSWMVYKGKYHLEMDNLGVPIFQETIMYSHITMLIFYIHQIWLVV